MKKFMKTKFKDQIIFNNKMINYLQIKILTKMMIFHNNIKIMIKKVLIYRLNKCSSINKMQ